MDDDKKKEIKQVCRIDIVFPVESDEHALKIKRAISDALKDVANKRFTFSIAEN